MTYAPWSGCSPTYGGGPANLPSLRTSSWPSSTQAITSPERTWTEGWWAGWWAGSAARRPTTCSSTRTSSGSWPRAAGLGGGGGGGVGWWGCGWGGGGVFGVGVLLGLFGCVVWFFCLWWGVLFLF